MASPSFIPAWGGASSSSAGEHLHEIVLEADIEPAGALVALAARTATELIVDPPRFVALGADDVQPAQVFAVGSNQRIRWIRMRPVASAKASSQFFCRSVLDRFFTQ